MKMLVITKWSTLIVSLLMLAGCASETQIATAPVVINYHQPEIAASLDQAAESATQSLAQLAAIQKARYPQGSNMPYANLHSEALDTFITLEWYGPVAPALTQIADAIGYKLQVFGKPPQTPILVNVNDSQQKTSAINLIRNIDLQAGLNANVLVYPKLKLISLRYTAS